jgi:pSer/pThr/pTyr-binding forkhead associated (FHA) protein
MIQLKLLSGKQAGAVHVARRFPVRIGRSARANLRVDDEGVWEQHLELDLAPAEGFVLRAQPQALATVNGKPIQQVRLSNGDAIQIGSLKMQFWLGDARQAGFRFRETLVWVGIAAVSLGQVAIVYWLLRQG